MDAPDTASSTARPTDRVRHRLAAFALTLALVFAAGLGLGRVIGDGDGGGPTPAAHDDHGSDAPEGTTP